MTTFCRTCNRRLEFIETAAKRKMPVEFTPYTGTGRPLTFGSYINKEGEVMKHDEVPDGMVVWRIHFQDCEGKSDRRETVRQAYHEEFVDAFSRIDASLQFVDRPATRVWGRHEALAHVMVCTGALQEMVWGERTDEERNALVDIAAAVVHYLSTGDKYATTTLIPPTRDEVAKWIEDEVISAVMKHGDAPWTEYEMLGILIEEVEEAFDNVKANGPPEDLRKELIQVAAVCVRHLIRNPEED